MKIKLLLLIALFIIAQFGVAQTTTNGVTTFTASKTIDKYIITKDISKVVINANVTLTGSFTIASRTTALTIEGKNNTTSIIKGTGNTNQDVPNIECTSAITLYLTNFTSYNSDWYHMRCISSKIIANGVRIIEDRRDIHLNSDGFSFGDASTFDNCYVDTWDDSFKMYYGSSASVKNTTIVHNQNGAPFQMGWGDNSLDFTFTLENVTVISNSASNYVQGVFSWAGGIEPATRHIKLVGAGLIRKTNPGMDTAHLYATKAVTRNKIFKVYGGSCSMVNPTSTNFKNLGGSTNKVVINNCSNTVLDTQAPTAPTGLTSSSIAQTSLTLSWTASTDNVSVSGYEVYDGTSLVASPTTTSVSITGLTCNTSHNYTVKAKDAAGNKSAASTAKSVTTSACTTNTTTHFEAESYSSMSGITKETTTDTGGGSNIASIHNNDYADYAFNVAKAGTYTTKFRVSSASNGGTIQVLKGTTVLGSVNVAVTGGWQTWTTITGPSINLTSAGTQTIRLKFVNTNTTGYLMNLNWWECAGSSAVKVARMDTEEIVAPSLNISLSPNPAKDFVNLTLDTEGATILLYSTDYKLLKKIISTSNVNQINVSDLTTGIYLVKVVSADKTKTLKFIKN